MKKFIGICAILAITNAMPAYAATEDSELRLALTKVTLYTETNEFDKAFALIDELKEKYPNNTQVMMAAADLNMKVDNQGSAFKYISQAQKIDPLDEDILERRRAVLQDHEPFVSIGTNFKGTNQANEIFAIASGKVFFTPTVNAEITVENDHLKSKGAVTRDNGDAEFFNGDKQRATISLSKLFDNGNGLTGFFHTGNETVGGGAEISIRDSYGSTILQGNLFKPEWEFVETVVGNGTKDNIYISRKQHISQYFDATLGGGLNRYDLEHDSDVAESKTLDFNFSYNYPYQLSQEPGDDIVIGAAYNLGGEYFSNRKVKTNSSAVEFNPFPAITYEVHSLTLSASKNITAHISADAYGGYAVDRFGSSGPLFGGGVAFSPNHNISLEAVASRGIIGQSNIGKVDQLGLNLKFRW